MSFNLKNYYNQNQLMYRKIESFYHSENKYFS